MNRISDYEIVVHTWGCKVNTYDSGLLETRMKKAGLDVTMSAAIKPTDSQSRPRVHVLNTCAVTSEASKEAARQVRKIKSREPLAKVVVTGCGAQVDGGLFDTLPGADLVIANSHKGQLEELIEQLFKGTLSEKVFRSNIFRKDDLEDGGGLESDHTRAFLKIQDGCNSFCTYCVIPFARGKSRSIPIAKLVSRIGELQAMGAQEVVLTGVHIGDYEDEELGKRFGLEDLVESVLAKTTIPRIRLSSLEPIELTDRLLSLYADRRLCPHFHMSIQSAQSETLSRMRRHYGAEDVERALNKIAECLPNAFVGMDLITGFPGETEDEFAETYSRLVNLPWTRIHVFPYSERPGTKALQLEGSIPVEVRARRAALIRSLSAHRFQSLAQREIGKTKSSLVLKSVNSDRAYEAQALTRNYWPLRVQSSQPLVPGQLIHVTVLEFVQAAKGHGDGWLKGVVATGPSGEVSL